MMLSRDIHKELGTLVTACDRFCDPITSSCLLGVKDNADSSCAPGSTHGSSPRRCCPSSRRHRRTSRDSGRTSRCDTETGPPHTGTPYAILVLGKGIRKQMSTETHGLVIQPVCLVGPVGLHPRPRFTNTLADVIYNIDRLYRFIL